MLVCIRSRPLISSSTDVGYFAVKRLREHLSLLAEGNARARMEQGVISVRRCRSRKGIFYFWGSATTANNTGYKLRVQVDMLEYRLHCFYCAIFAGNVDVFSTGTSWAKPPKTRAVPSRPMRRCACCSIAGSCGRAGEVKLYFVPTLTSCTTWSLQNHHGPVYVPLHEAVA